MCKNRSGVWPAGQVPSRLSNFNTKATRHTGTESDDWGVDTGKLLINDSHELLLARIPVAVRNRGNEASADVFGVAWVLAIGDRCGDERVLVLDTGRFCKVDHFVRVVLLLADITCRKECVDPGDTGQVGT